MVQQIHVEGRFSLSLKLLNDYRNYAFLCWLNFHFKSLSRLQFASNESLYIYAFSES